MGWEITAIITVVTVVLLLVFGSNLYGRFLKPKFELSLIHTGEGGTFDTRFGKTVVESPQSGQDNNYVKPENTLQTANSCARVGGYSLGRSSDAASFS